MKAEIFDCQDMPDDIRSKFFGESEASNDCYIDYWVEAGDTVGDWLIEEGAEDGEQVIIKHWW